MSAFKFEVGKPREVILGFDKPKQGTNSYGNWYLYGIKNGDLSSDEDAFFATPTLHTMIQTVGAGEGDKIKIEKCQEGGVDFFKVNDLTMNDMNSGGSAQKIAESSPHPLQSEIQNNISYDDLLEKYKDLKSRYEELKNANDIPF
tara:strand:+ start:1377 stop:1811 length:435 start_codon:yes stop_codon:yes gene_type:complete